MKKWGLGRTRVEGTRSSLFEERGWHSSMAEQPTLFAPIVAGIC